MLLYTRKIRLNKTCTFLFHLPPHKITIRGANVAPHLKCSHERLTEGNWKRETLVT